MTGKWIRNALLLVSAWCFVYDCYLWGGLYATPQVGRLIMREASTNSPLAAIYMFVGGKSLALLGKTRDAVDYAAGKFPEQVKDPRSLEYMPVFRIKHAQSFWGSNAYYLAPGALVLFFLLHLTRQRQIRSFGTRG